MLLGDQFWSPDALVDTGSPRTLFKKEVGDAIGLPWHRRHAEYEQFEMLGESQAAQRETVQLFLNAAPDVRWQADVWFFVEHWDWKLPVSAIFGNDGFFDEWAVTFLRREAQFVVEPVESYRSGRAAASPTAPKVGDPYVSLPREADMAPAEDWWRPTAT